MSKDNNITSKYIFDVSDLKKGISDAGKAIQQANADFRLATAGMDDWRKSTEGLQAKLNQLGSVLDSENKKLNNYQKQLEENQIAEAQNSKRVEELRDAYQKAAEQYGKNSKEAKDYKKQLTDTEKTLANNRKAITDLNVTITNQKAKVESTKKEVKNYENSLEELKKAQEEAADSSDDLSSELKDVGSSAKDAEKGVSKLKGGFTIVKGAIAGLVSQGISAAISGFKDLAESTREYRRELGLLKTVSDEANNSFANTKKNYKDLISVTGDEGAATEALNNLLTAGFTGKELDEVTNLIEGTAIKWKDTLKAEGLSDSIQEWLGSQGASLTGNFAEALERMGYNLEEVTAETAGFTDAQRRQWVIQTLTKEGLGEIADAYKENNKGLIDSSNATFDFNDAMARMGKKVEPVTTSIKQGIADVANELLNLSGNSSLDGLAAKIKGGFSYLIDKAIPALKNGNIGSIFTDLVGKINESIPLAVTVAAGFVTNLGQGLVQGIPDFLNKGLDAVNGLLDTIGANLPRFIEAGIGFIRNMVQGLVDSLPDLLSKIPEIISKMANLINDNAPTLIAGGAAIIWDLIKGILKAVPDLIANIPKIIQSIVDVWMAFNWLQLGKNAIEFISNGIKGMVGAAKNAIITIKDAIINIIKNLPETLRNLGQNAISNLGSAISGAADIVKQAATTIFNTIVDKIKEIPGQMISIGGDIVRGIWDGISNMAGWLLDKIGGWASDIIDGIAGFFGIESPSKVMKAMFKWVPVDAAEGIKDGTATLVKQVKVMADSSISKAKEAVSSARYSLASNIGSVTGSNQGGTNQGTTNVFNFNQTNNSPKPLSRWEVYRQTKNLLQTVKVGG